MADETSTPEETAPAVAAPRSTFLDLFRWPEWLGHVEPAMKIEELDEEGTRVVRAELPGIDPDKDVELTVDHGVLTISAHRRAETKSEEGGVYRSEFSYGAFRRSVPLPAGATEADVKASYHDGILEVRFPVDDEKAAAKKIPIARS